MGLFPLPTVEVLRPITVTTASPWTSPMTDATGPRRMLRRENEGKLKMSTVDHPGIECITGPIKPPPAVPHWSGPKSSIKRSQQYVRASATVDVPPVAQKDNRIRQWCEFKYQTVTNLRLDAKRSLGERRCVHATSSTCTGIR